MTDFVAASDRLVAAYNAKDFAALREMVSPTIDMAHFNRGFAVSSADDLMAAIETFSGGLMPNSHFGTPERLQAVGNVVMREAWWGGTLTADVPGFGSAGEAIRFKLCSVHSFDENGILVEWKDYG